MKSYTDQIRTFKTKLAEFKEVEMHMDSQGLWLPIYFQLIEMFAKLMCVLKIGCSSIG